MTTLFDAISRRRSLLLGAGILAVSVLLAAHPAEAQTFTLDFGKGGGPGSSTNRIIQLLLLLTVLSIAPAIFMMVTAFTRIVTVLSILRRALGTNTSPPNTVIMSLSIFMTAFIMMPQFQAAWDTGVKPLIDGKIEEAEAFDRSMAPFHAFMLKHVREKDLALFMNMAKTPTVEKPEDTPLQALIPAFMISELRRSFEIGFLIYIPFIIIDMVIASVLMSMGMMMLPPTMLSLPFKLIFFVLVDGWYILIGSLVQSFQN
ncbi:MAG: flagellar biosynthesis protein FliP [Rhodospirillaceae bacterium]|nr:MAG: flagellar biosynthesis protein FliP [Rhodospirillaceae bacterium]